MTNYKVASLCALAVGLLIPPAVGVAGEEISSRDAKKIVEKQPADRIKYSFLIDAGITGSASPSHDNQLFGRLFDDRNAEPLLNQATFTAERALAPEAGKFDWGFKFQATAGSDARFLNPTGEFENVTHDRNTVAVVRAYGNFHFPVLTSLGIDLKLGQFASPMSIENIYPAGNAFYSHSYIFNFGGPLQHLGGEATLHVNKCLNVYGGVVRGSNAGLLLDPNDVPSGIAGFQLTLLNGKIVVAGNTSVGPENPYSFNNTLLFKGDGTIGTIDANHALRYYNNVNVTWKATDALTSLTDSSYLQDDGLRGEAYGISQTFTYTVNKYLTAAVRGEVFRDNDNQFVFQYAANDDFVNLERGILNNIDKRTVSAPGTAGATYMAVTVGVQVKPIDHITLRPELRYDKEVTGVNAYTDSSESHQLTAGMDVLVTF